VEDVGTLAPHEFKTKISLTNIWQGAVSGVNTKNADRITGMYDFDLYYLLSAEQAEDFDGDYVLLAVSTQSAFGYGLKDSKVHSFFEINEAAKGNLAFIVDKLFVEFTTLDRLFTVDIGKLDLVDFFDNSAVANCEKSQFFAAPLVNNSAIPFPSKGLGVRVLHEPSDFWYAQASIADAQADKRETGFRTTFRDEDYFFSIAEVGIRPNIFNMPGTYRFILWYDPQDKSYLDESGEAKRDDLGFAVSFDQKITEKTTAFFRYGWADDRVNEIEDFVSFGGQIEGLIEGRDKDVLAIGYVRGLRSPDGLSSEDERQIDLIETYYVITINDNVIVTPNMQFVMDPGGLKSESPATVFGLRCRVKF
jgi:carbohydrate-selective porin OprB